MAIIDFGKEPLQSPEKLQLAREIFTNRCEDVLADCKAAETDEQLLELWYDLLSLSADAQRFAYQIQQLRSDDGPR